MQAAAFTLLMFTLAASGGPCPLLVPVGPLHPVQVFQRKFEAPRGCVSHGQLRAALDPEVHVIVLGPLPDQAVRAGERPVVHVSVRALGVQRRPLALVLVAAQQGAGVQWRLSASGLDSDLVNTLHVTPGSVWLCTGRCLRHRSSREAPAEPGAALSWAERRFGSISSYSALERADRVRISLGDDPSWPRRCEPRPGFLSPSVEASYAARGGGGATGCSAPPLPFRRASNRTHVIALRPDVTSQRETQTNVAVHVRSGGTAGVSRVHLTLVLLGPDHVHWVVRPHGIVGSLTVLARSATVRQGKYSDDGGGETENEEEEEEEEEDEEPEPELAVSVVTDGVPAPSAAGSPGGAVGWARRRGLPPVLSYTWAGSSANRFDVRIPEPGGPAVGDEEGGAVAAATAAGEMAVAAATAVAGDRAVAAATPAAGERAAAVTTALGDASSGARVPVVVTTAVVTAPAPAPGEGRDPAPGFPAATEPPRRATPGRETPFSMQLFHSELYLQPLESLQPLDLGHRVFVQVTMTSQDPDMDFGLLSCHVSPHSDPLWRPAPDSNRGDVGQRELIQSLCPRDASVLLYGEPAAHGAGRPALTRRRFSFRLGGGGDGGGSGGGGGGGAVLRFLHCSLAPCVAGASGRRARPEGGFRIPRCLPLDEACGQERPLFDALTSAPVTPLSVAFLLLASGAGGRASPPAPLSSSPPPASASASSASSLVAVIAVASFLLGALAAGVLCLVHRRMGGHGEHHHQHHGRKSGSLRVPTDCGANHRNHSDNHTHSSSCVL
ncbi:transforming growth factor beta receptor type 3-like isoform X2 [Petromyzon marinus]|uniref:transforming growth factor beta receptor type 3-like isoform X2 n=1 Tax=Petromyzon marinus TaxID=7757 RepID=UPI003F708930